jgi:hypothetical protein
VGPLAGMTLGGAAAPATLGDLPPPEAEGVPS